MHSHISRTIHLRIRYNHIVINTHTLRNLNCYYYIASLAFLVHLAPYYMVQAPYYTVLAPEDTRLASLAFVGISACMHKAHTDDTCKNESIR